MPEIAPPSPQAQRLLRVIVEEIDGEHIREGEPASFLSYSKALELMEIPSLGRAGQQLQRNGLNELSEWIIAHPELPRIDALIVDKKSHRPSSGFAKSHIHRDSDSKWEVWWMQQANRAIHYNWKPFLTPNRLAGDNAKDIADHSVREEEPEGLDYRKILVKPFPAHIGESGVAVGDVLHWLASGQSEAEIVQRHPGLSLADIKASLAFAADREKRAAGQSTLSSISEQWAGKLRLKPDRTDARLTYLLERRLKQMRGFLKGIDTDVPREADRI